MILWLWLNYGLYFYIFIKKWLIYCTSRLVNYHVIVVDCSPYFPPKSSLCLTVQSCSWCMMHSSSSKLSVSNFHASIAYCHSFTYHTNLWIRRSAPAMRISQHSTLPIAFLYRIRLAASVFPLSPLSSKFMKSFALLILSILLWLFAFQSSMHLSLLSVCQSPNLIWVLSAKIRFPFWSP